MSDYETAIHRAVTEFLRGPTKSNLELIISAAEALIEDLSPQDRAKALVWTYVHRLMEKQIGEEYAFKDDTTLENLDIDPDELAESIWENEEFEDPHPMYDCMEEYAGLLNPETTISEAVQFLADLIEKNN